MYELADKVIAYLNKQYPKIFRRLTAFDELNVIETSHVIYDEIYSLTRREAERLAEKVYKEYAAEENAERFDAAAFVLALMLSYNPTTKYVFENEMDRKRARFAESVIASDNPLEEIARATRLIAATIAQLMDDVTFDALIAAYKDNGAKRVRWITSPDDKRCKECAEMHNRIYPIDRVPAKPHIHCRCWIEEAKG